MAMLTDNHVKHGIQRGGPLDYCEICANKNNRVDYGSLEYKEVFKIYRNGLSTCLCMDHFKSMLDHYILVDRNELDEIENEDKPKKTAKEVTEKKEEKVDKKKSTKKK